MSPLAKMIARFLLILLIGSLVLACAPRWRCPLGYHWMPGHYAPDGVWIPRHCAPY
jgi:hypothetical protein